MSVIISNAEQICHSPTNISKAKMLFSFSRSSRFPKTKQNQCDQFYEINRRSLQASGLGYGKKYDFTKDFPKTPAPGTYESSSTFSFNQHKKKGFGFGSGRSQMEITGGIQKNLNPGPGAYQANFQRSSMYSSLKGRTKIDNRQQLYVPGPGTYQSTTLFSRVGCHHNSKFRNKSACRFSREEKMKIENRRVPGPGTYDTSRVDFSPQGKYFFSRLQSAKYGKFGRSTRLEMTHRCQTPGPGNYRHPSEFGYYIARNALQEKKQNTNEQL